MPSEHVARISRREFQRDLRKLRTIGLSHGFTVTRTINGRTFLHTGQLRIAKLDAKSRDMLATLHRIATAIGGPVEREMQDVIGDRGGDANLGFLHLRGPRPADAERVLEAFRFMKDAASSSARVEFAYVSRGEKSLRLVETRAKTRGPIEADFGGRVVIVIPSEAKRSRGAAPTHLPL